jgi:hypothetical protein
MNRFQPATPRAAFGLFAVAMTAFTLAIAVFAPARMDVDAQLDRFAARSGVVTVTVTSTNVDNVAPTQG